MFETLSERQMITQFRHVLHHNNEQKHLRPSKILEICQKKLFLSGIAPLVNPSYSAKTMILGMISYEAWH
jgi:hypothetical protein